MLGSFVLNDSDLWLFNDRLVGGGRGLLSPSYYKLMCFMTQRNDIIINSYYLGYLLCINLVKRKVLWYNNFLHNLIFWLQL